MNQNTITDGRFLEENLKLPTDSKKKQNVDAQDNGRKGIVVLKAKSSSKMIMGPGASYDRCFSGGNFASQYEDECPVNYSLKYSETESCKGVNKCGNIKKKFKDYTDYAETDLDQPTDFSLKYAEKTCEDDSKNSSFNYFNAHKVKFKEYVDYVETDLDQPTDFTLKYRESAEEDLKNLDFYFYENEEGKASSAFDPRRTRPEESEEAPCGRSQNETPLMFSRSSSMNSLSSFVHINQSIPDDRSSIVSDFSRMTSGIISPSELPDSPTQTAPSSPKRHKPSSAYSAKSDFPVKRSVFEDDVATYKQEDTPVEFSRTTSLSSLNLENPVKSELVIKRNATSLAAPKEENQNSLNQAQSDFLKQQMTSEKVDHDKSKSELASVLEVDESLCADCISIDIQIDCPKPKPNYGRLLVTQENQSQLRRITGSLGKPNLKLRFHNENRKGYIGYEGSDDAIHTYHTEGTPANVSHSGSHSDLSALSIASSVPFSGTDYNSDNESFFPEVTEAAPIVKSQLDYLKDHQLTAKDEMATFATENSPCDFSIRSSLNDLTINVLDPPLVIGRTAVCEEPPSQMLSPLRNVSPQSPNSVASEEAEDAEKCSEELQSEFILSESINRANDEGWRSSDEAGEKAQTILEKANIGERSRTESVVPANFEFDSTQPLTPFEEALLEECIRLGMPPKKHQKQLQEAHLKIDDEDKQSEKRISRDFGFLKSYLNRSKYSGEKSRSSDARVAGCDVQQSRAGKDAPNVLTTDNFDFDSSEPLTPFEEVLLEQCIRLGMPPKKNSSQDNPRESPVKYLNEETEELDHDSSGLITPLETALLEQCIRLGMPQKKNQKRNGNNSSEEPNKAMSCLTAHLNRLKLNSENEKDKDAFKKCDGCPCGKKHNRKKGTSCKRFKNRLDHLKVESCPV